MVPDIEDRNVSRTGRTIYFLVHVHSNVATFSLGLAYPAWQQGTRVSASLGIVTSVMVSGKFTGISIPVGVTVIGIKVD